MKRRKGLSVYYNRRRCRWIAVIHWKGKRKHVGTFITKAEAQLAGEAALDSIETQEEMERSISVGQASTGQVEPEVPQGWPPVRAGLSIYQVKRGKWHAVIRRKHFTKVIGTFVTEEEAVQAGRRAVWRHYEDLRRCDELIASERVARKSWSGRDKRKRPAAQESPDNATAA